MKLEKYKSGTNTYLRIVTSYRDPVTKKPIKDVHATLGNILNYDDGKPNLYERLKRDFNQGLIFREHINQDVEFTNISYAFYSPVIDNFLFLK